MSATYQDFLGRLKEERLNMEWSQLQIGQKLRMEQSHYSKAELGNRRFSFYEIQCLCQTKMDVYYIFTGYKCKEKYREFFANCTYEELKCYFNILCSAVELLHPFSVEGQSMRNKTGFIRYAAMPHKGNKTMFYILRRLLDYTQKKMADILEVDVKKLRNLESGRVLPDSEIMWRVSEKFGVSASIILEDADGLGCEIGHMLELIENKKGEAIFKIIKTLHDTV